MAKAKKLSVIIEDLRKSDKSLDTMTTVLVNATKFDGTYGELGGVETEELLDMREVFMDYIEKDMTQEFINKFHFLLEVERELTLREDE